jgi:predicted flap endonuclease-1-like 5' DNA nuclease
VSRPSIDATVSPDGADIDGLMRRVAAVEEEQPQPPATSTEQYRDDLKRISGIGPKLEQILNANGIFNFGQIAAWQEADIQAMDELLPAFRGRVQRDDWVGQARRLCDGSPRC